MTIIDADAPEQVRWRGDWIIAKQRGRWEYVSRARDIRAAVILALDGPADDRHIVLVDQYRVPIGRRVLELPAGLIGDIAGAEDEGAMATARRELEEETGYRAARWSDLGEFCSSPGMVSESFSLLARRGAGKGRPGRRGRERGHRRAPRATGGHRQVRRREARRRAGDRRAAVAGAGRGVCDVRTDAGGAGLPGWGVHEEPPFSPTNLSDSGSIIGAIGRMVW